MPKVLVLLATFDGMRWLPEQCRTILEQQGVDVHIVASDDCSSDGTALYLQQLSLSDSRVQVLPPTVRAGSAGQNFFRLMRDCESSGFDYVGFADQDDIWNRDKLQRACAALKSAPLSGYSSAVRAVYPNGRSVELKQSSRVTSIDFLFEGAGQGCTFLIPRAIFTRLQAVVRENTTALATVVHHDWLVYALCRSWGYSWIFDSLPSMHYRQHGSNELGAKSALSGIFKRWHMIRSGWYVAQVRSISELLGEINGTVYREIHVASGELGWLQRARWALMLGKKGRRKISDRIVLAIAAALGYV